MNEFYSISQPSSEPIDEFQLKNLGIQKSSVIFVPRRSDGYGGYTGGRYSDIKSKVTKEDYDSLMAFKISRINPPYELDQLIDYHLDYYISKGSNREKFILHVQYVLLPYLEQYYASNKSHIELIEKWIENQKNKKAVMIEFTDLTEDEKEVINTVFQVPINQLSTPHLSISKKEIEGHITTHKEIKTEKILRFLITHDFIELITYRNGGEYKIIDEGMQLLKCGSLEKYYERTSNYNNVSHPHISGNYNLVNVVTNGGTINQSSISINSNQYDELEKWGVHKADIEELKAIVALPKNKHTLRDQITSWFTKVTVSLVSNGIHESIPKLTHFIKEWL